MKRKRASFGALDIFLILLVVLCATGVAVRFVLTDEKGILASTPDTVSAAVQVLITNVENTSTEFFTDGGKLRVGSTGVEGEILSPVSVTPAEYIKEDENGDLVLAYQADENGKKDVRCTVVLDGFFKDGIFLLGGTEPIIPGAEIKLEGDGVVVNALVIDSAPLEE